jgi:hypothetical protein
MTEIIKWTNDNSGFLGLLIFIFSLLLGWITGLFNYFIKKPKFKIRIIEGATFGSIIELNKTFQDLPVNKTAIAVYLEITNIGNAPSSIGLIELGYLLSDFRPKWLTSRNWIPETFSKADFSLKFNDSNIVKGFPNLKQANMSSENTDTYLEIGKSANGMVYFEQNESYGNFMPRLNNDSETTDLIIKVRDAFDRIHKKRFTLKIVDPTISLQFNPYFGQTQYEYFMKSNSDNNTTTSE